ncbi:hypothetical protein ES705_35734 [subsurface metagenome]
MLKEIFILLNAWAGIISLILVVIFWLKFRQHEKKIDLLWKVLNPSPDKKITKLEIEKDEFGPHFVIEYDDIN